MAEKPTSGVGMDSIMRSRAWSMVDADLQALHHACCEIAAHRMGRSRATERSLVGGNHDLTDRTITSMGGVPKFP